MGKFQKSSAISKGLGNALETISEVGSLPLIAGQWFYVDPKSGANTADGRTIDTALKDIQSAYAKCIDGAGDGIVVLSRGSTSADTTSYQKLPIAWAKNGITVIGIAAPVGWGSRARIANVDMTMAACVTSQTAHTIVRATGSFITDGWEVGMKGVIADSGSNNNSVFTVTIVSALTLTISETINVQATTDTVSTVLTSYLVNVMEVTGSNNTFVNLLFGNYGSYVGSVGGVKLKSCARNAFINCQIVGAGHATPGAVDASYSLAMDEAQECLFEKCVIGTDTVKKASTSGEIVFDSTITGGGAAIVARIRFVDCDILSWSETSTKGALKSGSAISLARVMEFIRCRFINWDEGAMGNLASVFIGTKPTSGKILLDGCTMHGYAVWDSVANAVMYVSNGAIPAATGGLAIKAA
jgi:hypothetical protein